MSADTHGDDRQPWIGVDLDGTLAEYHGWKGPEHIGPPIGPMVDRVRRWLHAGKLVKIMTARVSPNKDDADVCRAHIRQWLDQVFGPIAEGLQVTHEKDQLMTQLWDDRCVQVVPNTGRRADGLTGDESLEGQEQAPHIGPDDRERYERLCERIDETNPEALMIGGDLEERVALSPAIVGFGQQHGAGTVLVYSYAKLVECFRALGMDDPEEWVDVNVECAYHGPGTPIILHDEEF